jgi:hypothetical protein
MTAGGALTVGGVMKTRVPLVAVSIGLVLCACSERPFVRADPPASDADVTVSLVSQRCGRRTRRDLNDVLDLLLTVHVTNGGRATARITPARIKLIFRGDAGTEPERHGLPSDLPPGSSSDLQVHFFRWGSAKCDEPMALSFDGAIEVQGRGLRLRPLFFVAEASDV